MNYLKVLYKKHKIEIEPNTAEIIISNDIRVEKEDVDLTVKKPKTDKDRVINELLNYSEESLTEKLKILINKIL